MLWVLWNGVTGSDVAITDQGVCDLIKVRKRYSMVGYGVPMVGVPNPTLPRCSILVGVAGQMLKA